MTRSGATRPAATSARRRVIVCSGATAKRVNWVMGFSQLWMSAEDGCSLTRREQAQIRQQVCTPIGQKSDLYSGFARGEAVFFLHPPSSPAIGLVSYTGTS